MVEFGTGLQSFPPFDKSCCNFSITIAYLPVVIHWKYKEHPDVFFFQMKNKIKTRQEQRSTLHAILLGMGKHSMANNVDACKKPQYDVLLLKMDIMRVSTYHPPPPPPPSPFWHCHKQEYKQLWEKSCMHVRRQLHDV